MLVSLVVAAAMFALYSLQAATPSAPSTGGTFGARYRKGADTPTGEAVFVFGAAGLTFRSTGSDWLVITGSRAVYQGSGTVDGHGGYGFRITATEGPDTYRIRIWKKSTGFCSAS